MDVCGLRDQLLYLLVRGNKGKQQISVWDR